MDNLMENRDNKGKYKVCFTTLGCKVNQFETEAMAELLEQDGFEVVHSDVKSDVYVINTCAVTRESDRKSRQLINRSRRLNPDALVVAVGCSVQLHQDSIGSDTGADLLIGTKNKGDIARLIREGLKNRRPSSHIGVFSSRESFEELKISSVHDKTRANIKIQDGCCQFCSYCIIPYVRGPIRSRSHDDIVAEVERIADSGYKEIVLNGIHVSSYGLDRQESGALLSLIRNIAAIDGIERIRLGSLEPGIVTDEFAKGLSSLTNVCPHFHLSLQSGSDSVLQRMNRKYTAREYAANVGILRKYMPDSGITTDIIAGFPGETDEEFAETMDFVREIGFSRIHVFKYSVREGTKAADMPDQVPDAVKSERSKRLIELGEATARAFMLKFLGRTMQVLMETEREKNIFEGYTTNYLKVLQKSDINIKNDIVNVKVAKIGNDCLIGEYI